MRPGEIYLNPLFPLAVRRTPKYIEAPQDHECTFLLCATDSSACINGDNQLSVENGFVWTGKAVSLRIESTGETWGVLIGKRLLDQLVVTAFGEAGFSNFLDELAGRGSIPCGAGMLDEVAAHGEKLIDELDAKRPAYRTHVRSLLTAYLMLLYRVGLAAPTHVEADNHRLTTIIDYLELHYVEELSVQTLAERVGYSPSHFSRVFTRSVGMPLSEYINRLRIRSACLLLKREGRSITEIAFEVGYNNVSFFNRYFKRVMNMTPREYRRYLHQ